MNALLKAATVAVPVAAAAYFCREAARNWTLVRLQGQQVQYDLMLLALAAFVATYLLVTWGWRCALNAMSGERQISFPESIAAVNTANVTKYIPGKVWSYAFQAYWLIQAGMAPAAIAYAGIVNLYIALSASFMLGLFTLVLSSALVPKEQAIALLAVILVADVLFMRFHGVLFRNVLLLVNRLFGKDIAYIDLPRRLMMRLYAINYAAALCFGAGAALVCFGIGQQVGAGDALLVVSSLLLSDVIAFLTLIAPGGIGVRESIMYWILNGSASSGLALAIPIATRMVTLAADALLGLTSFALLRFYSRTGRSSQETRSRNHVS